MTEAFEIQRDANGVRLVAQRDILIPGCLSDNEIDCNIKLLKDELDGHALLMKQVIRK